MKLNGKAWKFGADIDTEDNTGEVPEHVGPEGARETLHGGR